MNQHVERLIATLQVHLAFAETQSERLLALAQRITDPQVRKECQQLAKEAENQAAEIRDQIQQLEGEEL
jgi:protein-arginine kinase activator protein McsA